MMNCRQATRLMSDARERPLTLTERVALRLHTTLCSACRNFDRQVDLMGHMARVFARGDRTEAKKDSGQEADDPRPPG